MSQLLINQLALREFRGIRISQPINLSKFTVLIGRNNSGKTAILEALSLLPPTAIIPTLNETRIDLVASLHGGKSSLVYGYSGKATINYKLYQREVHLELTAYGAIDITIGGEKVPSEQYLQALSRAMKVDEESLPDLILFIPNDTRIMRELQRNLTSEREWSKVVKSGANTTTIKELVNPTVNDKFTEALIEREDIRLRKELPGGKVLYVKIADVGDGIERVLTTALWLESRKPKLILWDDIEASAHPGLIEALIRWLANKPWQIVVATHSIDVLDRIVAVQPKDTKIIALQKTPDDEVKAKTLTLDQVEDMLNKNIDLRKITDLL